MSQLVSISCHLDFPPLTVFLVNENYVSIWVRIYILVIHEAHTQHLIDPLLRVDWASCDKDSLTLLLLG